MVTAKKITKGSKKNLGLQISDSSTKKLELKQYDWYYVVAYVGEKRIIKAFPNARFIGWCLGKALFYVGDDTNIPIDEEDFISV